MALRNVKSVIQIALNCAFFLKNHKNRPAAGVCLQTPMASGGWKLQIQTSVRDTLEQHQFARNAAHTNIF